MEELNKKIIFLEKEYKSLKKDFEEVKSFLFTISEHIASLENNQNKGFFKKFKQNGGILDSMKKYGFVKNNKFNFTLNDD